jgi:hypothetical protein
MFGRGRADGGAPDTLDRRCGGGCRIACVTRLRGGRTWTVISAFAGARCGSADGPHRQRQRVDGRIAHCVRLSRSRSRPRFPGASHARVSLWHNDREIASGLGSAVYSGSC